MLPPGAGSIQERIERLGLVFNRHGLDPYGISRKYLAQYLGMLAWFYQSYFRVTVTGMENVPKGGRVMLVGNHSGGVAVDGSMVIASLFLELDPPRLCHSMADKFLGKLPFINSWMTKAGQMTGVPEHAVQVLEAERPLVVFPEGHHGTAKLYRDRNTLVDFGTGFMRMALATRSPIVPFGFIGAGDAIPTVANLEWLGKLLGVPYIPVTPYLLPLPRRVPLAIHYGKPLLFAGRGDEDDLIISRYVTQVKESIADLVAAGQQQREAAEARP